MSAAPTAAGMVTSLTRFVDAQVEMLALGSYQALSAPGSTLALTLSAFLTILIAVLGYNLLLGHAPSLREGVLTLGKVAVVFALATSWPAYQTLVYDVVIDAPGQLAGEIGTPAGVAGADGSLTQRLDLVDATLVKLAVVGPGPFPIDMRDVSGDYVAPPPFAGFNAFALGGGRIMFLVTSVGGLVAVRMIAGLMLALGPFFIAFLMFANTRSLFEGWIRVLAGAAIGSLALSLIMGLQLLLLEPWLAQALEQRVAGQSLPSLPSDLFVIVSLFTILVCAALFAVVRLCGAFRLALPVWSTERNDRAVPASSAGAVRASSNRETISLSRSEVIAEHLATAQLRDRSSTASGSRVAVLSDRQDEQRESTVSESTSRGLAQGRSSTGRTRHRVAASTQRRNLVS